MVTAHSSTAAIDALLDSRFATLEAKFQKQFDDLNTSLQSQLQQQIPSLVSLAFGSSPDVAGFGGALSSVVGNLLNGNNDPRTLANGAAQSFAPVVENYFNSSGAQMGEDLLNFINLAQRNL